MKRKEFTYNFNCPSGPLETTEIDGKRHYILPNGDVVPSVTTVLGHFKTKGLEAWKKRVGEVEAEKIKNRAATKGTRLHNLLESYCRGDPIDLSTTMPNTKWSFMQVKDILDEHVDCIKSIEAQLYCTKLRLAGRTDVIADYNLRRSIIDFKTSTTVKKREYITDYFEQGTAYAIMYESMTGAAIDQIVVIIANDYEPPQVFINSKTKYVDSLLDKVATYRKYIC